MLRVNYEYFSGILFVRLKGNLTKDTIDEVDNYLIPLLEQQGVKYLVYNLYELKSLDDYGVKVLKKGITIIKANQGTVYFCEVPVFLEQQLHDINKVENELLALELFNI